MFEQERQEVGVRSERSKTEANMQQVLVIGNGESRQNILLSNLEFDVKIGCNAVFRSNSINHLICCDKRMADEAVIHANNINTKIYVRDRWYHYYRKIKKDKRICVVPDLPFKRLSRPDDPFHWGSGPYAVLLSTTEEINADNIFLLGFDLYSKHGKVNNLFKSTENYANADTRPVDPSYWIYQISKVIKTQKHKRFIIVNYPNWSMPKEWQAKNTEFMFLEDFSKAYCKDIKYAV